MVDRSTSLIGAELDFKSASAEITGKEVDLMDSIHGLEPTYRTVQRAFPAYIGLEHVKKYITKLKHSENMST